jgi:threonylcarbamoyladenosine tRNA methylthiotransferase MtaB
LHVFPFSGRPGTLAENLPGKVIHTEKEIRSKILLSLSESKALNFRLLNSGRQENVLFEKVKNKGMITGFTGNYIRAEFHGIHLWQGRVKSSPLDIASSGNMNIELIDIL